MKVVSFGQKPVATKAPVAHNQVTKPQAPQEAPTPVKAGKNLNIKI
ncbi:MAG: hypothetical protein WCG23_09615 [bacterium]